MPEQFQYTKDDLERRLSIINENGEKIKKCIEYAIEKLSYYHNNGAKGLIVDDAMYDVYTKFDSALSTFDNYNNRVHSKINAKLEDMKPAENEKPSSNTPRRSIRIEN